MRGMCAMKRGGIFWSLQKRVKRSRNFSGFLRNDHSEKTGTTILVLLSLLISAAAQAQYAQAGQFQLSAPSIEVSKTFFEQYSTIRLSLDVEGVELRYALDGASVTEHSKLYTRPLNLRRSTTIKVRAWHADYQTSEEVQASIFRIVSDKTMDVSYMPDPAPQYAGEGPHALANSQKGSMNFRDGHWLGFSSDTIIFELNSQDQVEQLSLSVLEDHGSWIFKPEQVEVWQGARQMGEWTVASPTGFLPKTFQFIRVPLSTPVSGPFLVKVIMSPIPEWHDGKGTTPWLFIDEIFISD